MGKAGNHLYIIFIVIGAIVCLFIIVLVAYCCKSKSKRSEKDRKRYVYKYDPFTGKGNVAVIMEMSTSNGGLVTVEKPEPPPKTTEDIPALKKEMQIERPRSQSFTETRYVYRYNPASGEGSVERIFANMDQLAPKQPKSSRSQNCLAVELLDSQFIKKTGKGDLKPNTIFRRLSTIGCEGINELTKHFSNGVKPQKPENKSLGEVKGMKTRVGGAKRNQQGVHHVLLSGDNSKPPTGLPPTGLPSSRLPPTGLPPTGLPPSRLHQTVLRHTSLQPQDDSSDMSSTNTGELSRSASELQKLFSDNSDGTTKTHDVRKKRKSPRRSRSSVGEIFPLAQHYRRKSNASRLGLTLGHSRHESRGSEGHIFNHRRKPSDSTSASVDGDEDFTYRTLSLTSLTQTMWMKEYETSSHENDSFMPEMKEVPEGGDVDIPVNGVILIPEDRRKTVSGPEMSIVIGNGSISNKHIIPCETSPITHADIHFRIPEAALPEGHVIKLDTINPSNYSVIPDLITPDSSDKSLCAMKPDLIAVNPDNPYFPSVNLDNSRYPDNSINTETSINPDQTALDIMPSSDPPSYHYLYG